MNEELPYYLTVKGRVIVQIIQHGPMTTNDIVGQLSDEEEFEIKEAVSECLENGVILNDGDGNLSFGTL